LCSQLLEFNVGSPTVSAHHARFTASATPGSTYSALFGSGAEFSEVATVTVNAKGHR